MDKVIIYTKNIIVYNYWIRNTFYGENQITNTMYTKKLYFMPAIVLSRVIRTFISSVSRHLNRYCFIYPMNIIMPTLLSIIDQNIKLGCINTEIYR